MNGPTGATVAAPIGRCHVEHVMGMAVTIDIRDPALGPRALGAAIDGCVAWLHRVDRTFSTYRVDSEIVRLDHGHLTLEECSPEVRAVLARCADLRRRTSGFFDSRPGPNRALDPSGLVKGWAVQHASDLLRRAGSRRHFINAGGDIAAVGGAAPGRPWRVGIAHPLVAGALCAIVAVDDAAVATSGIAERGLHVFDPHSGRPVTELASVTVVGADLGDADAYATAALAMGPACTAWLEGLADHEAYVVDRAGHAWATSGFDRYLVDAG